MAEAKAVIPGFDFTVCEKRTKKFDVGQRKIMCGDFGPEFGPYVLRFSLATGFHGLDFFVPLEGKQFSSEGTTEINYDGPLSDLFVNFLWKDWHPGATAPQLMEPLNGWSFRLAVRHRDEVDPTPREETKVSAAELKQFQTHGHVFKMVHVVNTKCDSCAATIVADTSVYHNGRHLLCDKCAPDSMKSSEPQDATEAKYS